MKVVTYEGIVENGCIHVPAGVSLPERAKVYIVIPDLIDVELPRVAHVPTPRLVHPEQAKNFVKVVRDVTEDI
jgi:hypothetical protein